MFKFTRFKQLQNLIEKLGSIAADEVTYATKSYKRSTGSYTRIKLIYQKKFMTSANFLTRKNRDILVV